MQEVFLTIQGEGPLAGTPAVFIRGQHCHLHCKFCDSEFDSCYEISLKALLKQVQELSQGTVQLVVITGGEPMLQNIEPLCSNLISLGYRVQIETAGTLWVPGLEDMDELMIVVSPKVRKVHAMIEKHAAAWKYIVTAGEVDVDGLPIGSTQLGIGVEGLKKQRMPSLIARPPKGTTVDHIFVQPCDEHDLIKNEKNVAFTAQIAIEYGYRLSLQ